MDLLKEVLAAIPSILYRFLNYLTRGVFGILVTTIRRFIEMRSLDAAAGLAYYSLFSLFPLSIFLIALGSYFLEDQQVQQKVLSFLTDMFPTANDLIEQNIAFLIEQNITLLIDQRGFASLSAIIGLLWAGSGAFTALAININRAWPNAEPRNFVKGRMIAFVMVFVLALLLFLSLFSTTMVTLFPIMRLFLSAEKAIEDSIFGEFLTYLFSLFSIFIMFLSLYRWVPNTEVTWAEAFWAALIATIGWRWAIAGFTWFLSSGLANFQVFYGTLGTVIALMVWIYIVSLITLFGAHLSAAIAKHQRLED